MPLVMIERLVMIMSLLMRIMTCLLWSNAILRFLVKRGRGLVDNTRCTSHGKVCMVILDSDSFENVVFLEMVQKLGLQNVPRSNPHQLCRLQKGNEIKVRKWCLVTFSIDKNYKDEVWCDINLKMLVICC